MATTACTGMSVGHGKVGTVVAVRRQCSSLASDCKTVCQQAQGFSNGSANKFVCFDALHVYKNRPSLGNRTGGTEEPTAPADEGKYGPVIHRYGGCGYGDCGPNYCCCIG